MLKSILNQTLTPRYFNLYLIIKDLFKINQKIYPNDFHIKKAINWLIVAQKQTNDGGVSAGYSLFLGWRPSYPETSGYLIPTFLNYSKISENHLYYLKICKDIAEWECSIQLENGGFQGDLIGKNKKPVVFNTGQIILGLVNAYKEIKNPKYLECAIKAGDFLVTNQEGNGNWKKFCHNNISHTYNVRVAWALLELFLITDNVVYEETAIKNLKWALNQVNKNFWFNNNSFKTNRFPYLHNISYAIRGFLEAGIILEDNTYLNLAKNSSLQLLNYFERHKFLPSTFNPEWESKDYYSCLTGDAQLSIIWLKLYKIFYDERFLVNAIKINKYLKLNQILNEKCREINGAIKGSDPIWGRYLMFNFSNWTTKFFCDALMLENQIISTKKFIDVKRI